MDEKEFYKLFVEAFDDLDPYMAMRMASNVIQKVKMMAVINTPATIVYDHGNDGNLVEVNRFYPTLRDVQDDLAIFLSRYNQRKLIVIDKNGVSVVETEGEYFDFITLTTWN
jgi:hypothetical protein